MSPSTIFPSLAVWAQNGIAALYQATSQSTFINALDAFLAQNVNITVNGMLISRANFSNQIQFNHFDEINAIVKFIGTVEVPTNESQPLQAGSVGLFYNTIIQESIRVEDAPVSRNITACVNIVIEQDTTIALSTTPSNQDRRRVVEFNQIYNEKPVPFRLNL